ncbi:nuclear transport factor 2 family protein [Microbacterium sp. QXD-8]|uniref:Nuclear transport factor 2 family protein n=1 Tax=Microbacterium psychrotolerans TaxID=3068321 RepID=A0ABU0YVZ7_9MICO|nr:nuclear transport factor 2 family protein [Microbacterium sp. QXD-8]MDQ7876504.1 nuclear transport factor 2 family protein [Microbacterium sp. QXD-8]
MSLESRIAALEAKSDICDLKARYARICDDGYDGDAIAELFIEGGSWASNTYPEVSGRLAIARFMREIGRDVFPWAVHLLSNPRVDVALEDGTAVGRWDLLQIATQDQDSVLALGRYEDRLELVDGDWRFTAVRVDFSYVGTLAEGWGRGSSGFLGSV